MTDKLIIQECPAAFLDFATKHNGIVYLLQNMRGVHGISVYASDANIIIDGGTGGGSTGDAVSVVGTVGKLVSVAAHSASPTPEYPTVLKVVNGTTSIILNSDGITMLDSAGSGKTFQIAFTSLSAGITVGLRVDDFCDGTTAKKMQHIASSPYT